MANAEHGSLLPYLRRVAGRSGEDRATDQELLGRFAAGRDETAFELLLWRYGALVRHVCLGVTRDVHNAEDAMQATFLVLARKAGSVRNDNALGSWLYRVAYRIARRARGRSLRTAAHEQGGLDLEQLAAARPPPAPAVDAELRSLLLEEVDRLPAKYRTPIVLCYLEGRTHEDAARQLGWPKGTVSGRLARARDRLRARLGRRGLSLSVGALTTALAAGEAAALAPDVRPILQAALRFAAHLSPPAGPQAGPAVLLAEGMVRSMFVTRLQTLAALVLALTLLGSGAGLLGYFAVGGPRPTTASRLAPVGGPDDQAKDRPPTPQEQLRQLVREFDAGSQRVDRRDGYEKRALKLAEDNPGDQVCADALLWVLQRGRQANGGIGLATTQPFGPSAGRALELLAKNHARDKRVGVILEYLSLAPPAADQFLRAVQEQNPDRTLQAQACLSLASRCQYLAELANFNRTVSPLADSSAEAKARYALAEKYFALAASKYGDVPYAQGWTMAEFARGALFEVRHLVIGKPAPEIEGEDLAGQKLKLSDYRGKVVLLDFSWWGTTPGQTINAAERSLEQKYVGRPFALLGISRDQDRALLQKIKAEEMLSWRSWFDGARGPVGKRWLDGGAYPGPITARWNVRVWPTLYLLDSRGVIRDKSLGFKDMDELIEKLIRQAEAEGK
jgi:RNA polymerase sigma factor (sigma-70 family)